QDEQEGHAGVCGGLKFSRKVIKMGCCGDSRQESRIVADGGDRLMDYTFKTENVAIPVEGDGNTSGILFLPEGSTLKKGVILAHGAGNNMNTPFLAAFSAGLARAGYPLPGPATLCATWASLTGC
ncbi:MAG: hypothetical protein C0392_10605, partial [Syntrophus sp. (in: bacteria)]|nr:hypothetical protein [Syntrophus sp. (in: bacteria)]